MLTTLNRFSGLLFGTLLLSAATAPAQWIDQTLTLNEGWNAVQLWVQPATNDCDRLFGAAPRILSVRRWAPPPVEDVQYDTSTGAILPQTGSWLTWFPPTHPDRALLNLAEVAVGSYLIEVSAGTPVTLNIRGCPQALTYTWQPGSHHFVGLPVYSSSVSFSSFFAAAGSGIRVDYQSGGEVYTVTASGAHQRVFTPATTLMAPGTAYWIKAQQYSTYGGAVEVKLDSPAGWISFGRPLVPQYVELRNVSGSTRGVKLAQLDSAVPPSGAPPFPAASAPLSRVPLNYALVTGLSEAQGRVYQPLTTWSTQLLAGATVRLALLPDASQLVAANTNAAFQSILEITDDAGTAGTVRQRFGVRAMARLGAAAESQGLWVGEVTVTKVGRLEMPQLAGSPDWTPAPVPVARPFNFRLLAHVDSTGTARLLQQVFVGTRPDTANGGVITELMASEAAANAYKSTNAGAAVFRMSSANSPFMQPVAMSGGAFGVPAEFVRTSFTITNRDPSNPFLHVYAPLHDNKERRNAEDYFFTEDVETFSVRREITLAFKGPETFGSQPRWGETLCGGVYTETIRGLGGTLDQTNRVIEVEGQFVMQRASPVATLRQ